MWSLKKGYTCPRELVKSSIEDLETKIRLSIFITFYGKRKRKIMDTFLLLILRETGIHVMKRLSGIPREENEKSYDT